MNASVGTGQGNGSVFLPERCESLGPFVRAGILDEAAVHVAASLCNTAGPISDEVALAAALCVRALQRGHVCVEPATVADTVTADDLPRGRHHPLPIASLPWPETDAWATALATSDVVAVVDPEEAGARSAVIDGLARPLVFDGTRVYLERYWRYERQVGDALLREQGAHDTGPDDTALDDTALEALLDRYFPPSRDEPGATPDAQRGAASLALRRHLSVIAGGPGTGKTYTIARMLAVAVHAAADAGEVLDVALAAPTGKAAARMGEAVAEALVDRDLPETVSTRLRDIEPSTIHRLLGYRDGITFRHDHTNPLPHDLVVLDESSMVALPLMARLLDALRPGARLVLVGDPFQLASIEAGAVLGDVVGPVARAEEPVDGPLSDGIAMLRRTHRFGAGSGIEALAAAVRADDPRSALDVLADPDLDDVVWIDPDDADTRRELTSLVIGAAADTVEAARSGDIEGALRASSRLKVLCGTHGGDRGTNRWTATIEKGLSNRHPEIDTASGSYVGRPVIITANDYVTGVFNGDTGLVVSRDGQQVVALPGRGDQRLLSVVQLDVADTWWATTIHKSQGSEFPHAVVSLPDADSRILTNELLYTAVTRARDKVTVLGSEAAITAAVGRRVSRASGLGARLWQHG